MFISGTATLEYSSKRPKDIRCHNCGHIGQTFVRKFLRYWHIWFIPMFPFKLWKEYECVRCEFSNDSKNLTFKVKNYYDDFQPKKVLPLWTFTGFLSVLGFLIWLFFKSKN